MVGRFLAKWQPAIYILAFFVLTTNSAWSWPQTWVNADKPIALNADRVFNVGGQQAHGFNENGKIRVQLVDCSAPAQIFWPGEKPTFTFQIENLAAQEIATTGKIDVIQYELLTPGDDFFGVTFHKLADVGSVPFTVDVKPGQFTNLTVNAPIPERFGGYAVVLDFGSYGRLLGAMSVRVIKTAPNLNPYSRVELDATRPYPDVFNRLGAMSDRVGAPYITPTDPAFENWYANFSAQMTDLREHHITTTVEFCHGITAQYEPWGLPWRNSDFTDANGNRVSRVNDNAPLPQFDAGFAEVVHRVASDFGWPKGPVIAVKIYNEPWEGGGIDGWGADMIRYREIYDAMLKGVDEAKADSQVDVLTGGCDSSDNTFDKFLGGDTDHYLRSLDFISLHYQGTWTPEGYQPFLTRINRYGKPDRVRIWDTESWMSNSDERVSAALPTYCAAGYDRVVGIEADDVILGVEDVTIRTAAGGEHRLIKRPWSVCAAFAGFSAMIGDRPFRQFLFTNGLPWVEVFDGAPKAAGAANKEDGTVVVIGDLGTQFNRNRLPYRSVSLHNGSLTVADPTSRIRLFDGYGNRIAAVGGKLIVPLSTSGYYMRGDGKSGSFTLLLAAIESARITGYDPVNIVAHDLLSPISAQPTLNVSLTNVLSRPVTGRLSVSLGELKLEAPDRPVTLGANESRAIMVRVIGGVPVPDNSYPLNVAFKTDHDGQTSLAETMHVNVIAHFTPRIDGNLDDWKGILPQPILPSGASTPSAQETAWFPWKKFDTTTPAGLAVGYLAYDERNFYFAAKIADTTPDEGMHRMETANDDEYFFPAIAYKDGKQYNWPDGVRRYSYVKEPELPSGDFPYRDNVQIGFNVLGDDEKSYRPYPPGTCQEFGDVPTNDYEFALNPIAARYGGGTEIWKLHAPGMPEKNFYPRQPKGPLDGPVRDGQLAFTRDDQTRYVECAIPWTDIPQVKRALVVNKTIKFSFRVNDNSGNGCMELSRGRSVAKRGLSFQVYWLEHWTNEVEFSFQK